MMASVKDDARSCPYRSGAKEIINGLTQALVDRNLNTATATAIGAAIEFLQSSFFNEDASREIDRLILLVEQQAALIEQLEAGNEG